MTKAKTITALEVKWGDTIETTNGHIFEDVYVEFLPNEDNCVVIYGQTKGVRLNASQMVYLLVDSSSKS